MDLGLRILVGRWAITKWFFVAALLISVAHLGCAAGSGDGSTGGSTSATSSVTGVMMSTGGQPPGTGGQGGQPSGLLKLCVLGAGKPEDPCLTPAELDYGTISTGTQVTRLFRVDNDTGKIADFTGATVDIGNFTVTTVRYEKDPGDPSNLLRVVAPLPVSRNEGESLWFEVTYTSSNIAGPLPAGNVHVTDEVGDTPQPEIIVPIKGEESGCPQGSAACDNNPTNGCETNTNTDPNNCGSCGHSCTFNNASGSCVNGMCQFMQCNQFFMDCNGNQADGCEVNILNDPNHCGSCAFACDKLQTNSFCNGGNCGIVGCLPTFGDCDLNPLNGCETNLGTSMQNCGGCNLVCNLANASETCVPNAVTNLGVCTINTCDAGFKNCDNDQTTGCETNTQTDTQNCGNCFHQCDFLNATSSCDSGVCDMGACDAGFSDCDGNQGTGCEVNLTNNAHHCGACGTDCNNVFANSAVSCTASTCNFNGCAPNFYNIDGSLGNGCEYACTFQSATDKPDDSFIDANCDGIDGDVSAAIFVATTGSDANPGTMALPMATITAAMGKATTTGKSQVYVSEGIYQERVTLTNGVSLYGGYSITNHWARSVSYITTIRSSTVSSGIIAAVTGTDITSPTTVDHFVIQTGNAVTAGVSNYGVYCDDCTALTLNKNNITAGDGGAGSPGSGGSTGGSGSGGSPGNNGTCDSGNGSGGPGGGSACGRNGGNGGAGGPEGSHAGTGGGTGVIGTPGGGGGTGGDPGGAGGTGQSGSSGSQGVNGGAGAGGMILGGFWISSNGGPGGVGNNGNGGGGGGGGGGQGCTLCNDGGGNGGGGGGGGGCGGTGAGGGTGGGGSFGLFIVDSGGMVLSGNLISSGNGGMGGAAGAGGIGGGGGSGSGGATNCTGEIGRGGDGGNGGSGGQGGHGGGGAGGPSWGVYHVGALVSTSGNTIGHGNGGVGGMSFGNSGSAGGAGLTF